MSGELLLAALLAAAVVVFVALPFLRESAPEPRAGPAEEELAAAEERDRALAELKELEFDHRTGKITDEDYRALVGPLRQRAALSLLPDRTTESRREQQFSSTTSSSDRLRL